MELTFFSHKKLNLDKLYCHIYEVSSLVLKYNTKYISSLGCYLVYFFLKFLMFYSLSHKSSGEINAS